MNWIVFDFGEFISKKTTALPKLAATMGVEPGAFEPHYWARRDRYDRGGTDLQYWSSIGDSLGVTVNESISDELTAIDIDGWLHIDPETVELLAALEEAGAALALLSNAPSSFARVAERQDWAKHFRVKIFSGDLKCAKPDKEIFTTLLKELAAAAADCLFFDDKQVNIDGALAAGLKAYRWLGASDARNRLD